MHRKLTLIPLLAAPLIVLAAVVFADVAGDVRIAEATKTVDCYCTDRSGARIELGQTICMQVDGKMFMAQCQMSLNSPMWRRLSDGCATSALPQSLPPQG